MGREEEGERPQLSGQAWELLSQQASHSSEGTTETAEPRGVLSATWNPSHHSCFTSRTQRRGAPGPAPSLPGPHLTMALLGQHSGPGPRSSAGRGFAGLLQGPRRRTSGQLFCWSVFWAPVELLASEAGAPRQPVMHLGLATLETALGHAAGIRPLSACGAWGHPVHHQGERHLRHRLTGQRTARGYGGQDRRLHLADSQPGPSPLCVPTCTMWHRHPSVEFCPLLMEHHHLSVKYCHPPVEPCQYSTVTTNGMLPPASHCHLPGEGCHLPVECCH